MTRKLTRGVDYPVRLARDGVVTSDGRIIHLGKKYATKLRPKRRRSK